MSFERHTTTSSCAWEVDSSKFYEYFASYSSLHASCQTRIAHCRTHQGLDRQNYLWLPTTTLNLSPRKTIWFSWIGPPVDAQKKRLKKKKRVTKILRLCTKISRRGESRSTVSIFVWSIFELFFQNNFPNSVQTKIDTVNLDSPCQILLFRGLRPFWGASVCWGINFKLVKEVKLICVCSIILRSRVPAIV